MLSLQAARCLVQYYNLDLLLPSTVCCISHLSLHANDEMDFGKDSIEMSAHEKLSLSRFLAR